MRHVCDDATGASARVGGELRVDDVAEHGVSQALALMAAGEAPSDVRGVRWARAGLFSEMHRVLQVRGMIREWLLYFMAHYHANTSPHEL
jgi:hypothetical protein